MVLFCKWFARDIRENMMSLGPAWDFEFGLHGFEKALNLGFIKIKVFNVEFSNYQMLIFGSTCIFCPLKLNSMYLESLFAHSIFYIFIF